MKNILLLLLLTLIMACKKDQGKISDQSGVDSSTAKKDSTEIPTIKNPDQNAAFEIIPQDILSQKGRAVFLQNGKVLIYFDQNSNSGNIRIDGSDYTLNKFDFTENSYLISGNGIKIEALEGDFKDGNSDCVEGNFPEVKISLNGKVLNLANVIVKDCPNY